MNITVSSELDIEADQDRHGTMLSQQYCFGEGCFQAPALASLLHLYWAKPGILFGAKPYLMRRTMQNYLRPRSNAPDPPYR